MKREKKKKPEPEKKREPYKPQWGGWGVYRIPIPSFKRRRRKFRLPKHLKEVKERAKAGDVRAKMRFLEELGAGKLMASFRKRAGLKEFEGSMRRLKGYLADPAMRRIYFIRLEEKRGTRERIPLENIKENLENVEKAFKAVAKKNRWENKAELFDSVERMRISFGSDYKVVVGGDRSGGTLLVASLMANMREAAMHLLLKDKKYLAFAEKARKRTGKHLKKLAMDNAELKALQKALKPFHRKSLEVSGGAKIVVEKGKPKVKMLFLNPETAYWDNAVIIKPLIEKEADFYFHSHPAPSGFSWGGKSGRWNLDEGTAKALKLPFLLFNESRVDVLHNGKTYTLPISGRAFKGF